jgi:hypothetical protein
MGNTRFVHRTGEAVTLFVPPSGVSIHVGVSKTKINLAYLAAACEIVRFNYLSL